MKITRETDHATKCVLYLSHKNGEYISIGEIATANGIPRSFLAKILQKLTKGGIVESLQGQHGGFRLTREPEKISLLEVFECIQGPMVINQCVVSNQFCNRIQFCSVHPIWQEIRQQIETKLRSTDFRSLSQVEQVNVCSHN